jgi:MFS family permease
MAQWASGYLEASLGIPKVYGDIFGVAMFGAMLGLGRTLYAKFGKNICKVLLLCAIGSVLCYFVAAISPFAILGLVACAFCGFCTSMLWPGNLVVASDRFASGGVVLYALMAAGGDFGASVVPQLVGIITDTALENSAWIAFADGLGFTPEQFGMKVGILVGMIFPLIAVPIFIYFIKTDKKQPTYSV